MPKRPSKPRRDEDPNQAAFRVVRESTDDDGVARAPVVDEPPAMREKNAAAVALGRLGGKKGGKNRMASMTREERTALAKAAAAKRWGERKD
jgi:hypothetical protein